MYSQTSNYPSESRRIDLDPKVKDRFGQPAMRMTHDWREEDKRSVEFRLTIKRRIARALLIRGEEPLAPLYHLSTHEVGVTRMGEDPKTSVVDIYGRSHECDRPYVIGGGQFPTYMGYNPTGTIQAMAYMTAEQLVK